MRGWNRNALLVSSAIVSVATATPAAAQTKSFDVPAQSVQSAVTQLGRQADIQIIAARSVTRRARSTAVRGNMTVEQALSTMLQGTGLTFRQTGPQTFTVVAAPRSSGTQTSGQTASSSGEGTAGDAAVDGEGTQDIVVTGTLIRNAAPIGSDLKVYDRKAIDQSGAASVEQFARQITENFSNNDLISSEGASSVRFGQAQSQNVYSGASFNLRGVGPSATLTLINGSRLAPSGNTGGFTDISLIPLSAVERIEILTDGASATYGADAVAGVVNIIMRDDYEGAESRVLYGGATDGGAEQVTASQLAGVSWSGGNAVASYQYSWNSGLDASERSYLPPQGGPVSLLPRNQTHSVFARASHAFDGIKLFGTFLWGKRDSLAYRRTQSAIIISASDEAMDVSQIAINGGMEIEVSGDWIVKATGNYSKVDQRNLGNSVTEFPGLFTSTSVVRLEANSELAGGDVLLSGTLAQLPAGALKTAVGASYREERFHSESEVLQSGLSFPLIGPNLSRNAKSAFGEVRVPLFGQASGIGRVDLSAALRYDDYSDFGSSTTYKIGAEWTALEGLRLRGTYGTSFRAPLLADLGSPVSYFASATSDGAGGSANVITLAGGNPALQPEESRAWTLGLDLTPRFARGVRVSLSYFNIDFSGRIQAPAITGSFFTNPVAAPFVVFNPPVSTVQTLFAQPGFQNFLPPGQGPETIAAIFDPRVTNIASTKQSGLDMLLTYTAETEAGTFDLSLVAQHLIRNRYRALADTPSVDLRNRFSEPPKWKGRATLSWLNGPASVAATLNFVNAYRNGLGGTATTPGSSQRIKAYGTADLHFSYAIGNSGGAFRDLTAALTITNLTDRRPPYVEIPAILLQPGQIVLPFDAANASPVGRQIALSLSKKW